MPQTYTIKPGDNLTKIGKAFGVSWRDIWQSNSYIKDPNLIYAGKTLVIPDAPGVQQPAASLEKTLPSATSTPTQDSAGKTLPTAPAATPQVTPARIPTETPGAATPTYDSKSGLPSGSVDQMTLLKIMLGEASTLATKQGTKAGLTETFAGLANQGVRPENVSGNLTSRIIDFVEGQVSKPIEKNFDKMSLIVDSMSKTKANLQAQTDKLKDDARQQISQAISGDMWNNMNDDQRQKLWDTAGYSGKAIAAKNSNLSYYHVTDDNGDIWNVGYDKTTGAITSKENLGSLGKSSTTPTGDDKEIASFNSDASSYIVKLDNGEISWGTAWDALHTKYPKASSEAIDSALGGGYNPTTQKWWGRASTPQ